jgi:hypothetical protein
MFGFTGEQSHELLCDWLQQLYYVSTPMDLQLQTQANLAVSACAIRMGKELPSGKCTHTRLLNPEIFSQMLYTPAPTKLHEVFNVACKKGKITLPSLEICGPGRKRKMVPGRMAELQAADEIAERSNKVPILTSSLVDDITSMLKSGHGIMTPSCGIRFMAPFGCPSGDNLKHIANILFQCDYTLLSDKQSKQCLEYF